MKITTFDPEIISKQSEEVIAFFKELGFKKRHASYVYDRKNAPPGTRTQDRIQQTQERSGFPAVTFILYPKLYPNPRRNVENKGVVRWFT